jgi:hypothetical protein
MLDHTIQKTIYLYWTGYKEFKDINKAVAFAQKIYFNKQYTKMIELSKKWKT